MSDPWKLLDRARSEAVVQTKLRFDFADGSSATFCVADPGSSVAVRDKNNVVEYLG
jgi:hypothetical protein